MAELTRPVILFDGVCHLCNRFVQFVLERDLAGHFDFAPLQSDFARQRLGPLDLTSVVLLEKEQVLYAEIAVLRILLRLKWPWPSLARLANWLPHPLLAACYRLVAQSRYQIFGRDDVCSIPLPQWKGRFLS